MAYYTKYRAEFKDILEETWRIDIQEVADEQGEITTFQCTGTPLFFEWYGADDIYTQNIIGSKMSLNIWSNTDFALSELFTSDNLEFKVIVYHDTTPYWSGFILAESYEEPYDAVPLNTTIVATDGLGLLKDYKFVDLGYTTRQKCSVIIYAILNLVGITTFTEYINIYNENMDDTVDDSPLDQMGIDPDLFLESTCYEALESILKMLNAGIKQDHNVITIHRFNEVSEATIYGRIFTSGTVKTSTSKSSTQYINRDAEPSAFWDVEGGTLSMLPQAKEYIINYDLGLKESCLEHWEFKFDDFVEDEGVYTIDDWSKSGSLIVLPLSLKIPGEGSGVYLYTENESVGFYTQVIPGVKTRAPKFKISIDYRMLNKSGDVPELTSAYFILSMVDDEEDTYYWDDINKEWSTCIPISNEVFRITTELGWSDWHTKDFIIDNIPFDGDLTVKLASTNDNPLTEHVAYKDIKVIMTPAEGDAETGIGYNIACASTGKIIETDIILGDGFTNRRYIVNQLLNFSGIVNDYSSGNIIDPSLIWHTRGNTEYKAILEVIGEELGTQYELPRQLIDLPMYEMTSGSYFSGIGNLVDTLNVGKVFYPNISTFDVRERKHQLILTEIR